MDIRNICLLGHGGSGKTSLVESMLYLTGATDRLGKPADGNTVCDYDPEEIKRQISISLAMTPVIYNGVKINVLDTPGNFDFAGEMQSGVRAAEVGVLVCASKDGLSVGAERCWKYLKERKKPCIVYISKEDEENANFSETLAALREKLSKSIAPVVAPIWDGNKRTIGIIDVINRKAYQMPENKKGKRVEIPIPDSKQAVLDELYGELMEAVAETSDEKMEKFFEGEPFTKEEIMEGLKIGVREGTLAPVVCGSALTGLGTEMLMSTIIDLVPASTEMPAEAATDESGENAVEVRRDPNGPAAAIVFKTISDQYGKYSLVKVVSGKVTSDMSLYNPATGKTEKLGRLYTIKGKKNEEVKEIACGDIGAIAKMDRLKTGDTLCDPKQVVKLAPTPFAEPCYSRAIAPKTRGQDEKVGSGLIRLNEEDPTFTIFNNAETHQVVVSGAGDIQIDVLVSKLKSRFGVDAELDTPRVAYREKIRKQVRKQGRHKKQTGGSGQFGDVHIVFEPQDEQEDMIFAEEVFGGSVPKNFFPAVEKGLREACAHGVLAGYPMVFLKATLVDGSYHPVDSSEIAFKTAAQLAYKAALPEASPVLLEPIGELKVKIPDSYMGDILGDLNKRRGRVMGMNPTGDGDQIVEAEVPEAEMMTYAIDLRSMTQSRGSFTFHFVRYEDCPAAAQEKAIAEAKALAEAE
ncbi:MAG: elongation factor G [Oscillospiraceae bacterium]|jgi:elongation factor G|nr:elongation factor G [Oscillospiraceae bacterium]